MLPDLESFDSVRARPGCETGISDDFDGVEMAVASEN
jgi:hypothetical protein